MVLDQSAITHLAVYLSRPWALTSFVPDLAVLTRAPEVRNHLNTVEPGNGNRVGECAPARWRLSHQVSGTKEFG